MFLNEEVKFSSPWHGWISIKCFHAAINGNMSLHIWRWRAKMSRPDKKRRRAYPGTSCQAISGSKTPGGCDTLSVTWGKAAGWQLYEKADNKLTGSWCRLSGVFCTTVFAVPRGGWIARPNKWLEMTLFLRGRGVCGRWIELRSPSQMWPLSHVQVCQRECWWPLRSCRKPLDG